MMFFLSRNLGGVSLFVALICGAAFDHAAPAEQLRAGTARIELTPPLDMKAPLGGYGERMNRPAEGIHDPIFVKALVLTNGQQRIAIVTADLLGFPPTFKQELINHLGPQWTSYRILLLPSHSHTSIEMNAFNSANTFSIPQIGIYNPKLRDWVLTRCATVIQQAAKHLQPIRIGTMSESLAGWNRNRRHDAGTVDDVMTVTRIDLEKGDPLAVLVNFTAHPTFMSAEDMQFSGDWPGHLQRALERSIGSGVNVMYYNGAEGDQSPVGRPQFRADRWQAAELFGNSISAEAKRLWDKAHPQSEALLTYRTTHIALPERTWHPQFRETGGAEYGLTESVLQEMLPRMFPHEITTTSVQVGELIIMGVPGEMIADLGLALKAHAKRIPGVSYATIGGLADAWISYILSPAEYRAGGYEASVSFYGPELGPTITQAIESTLSDWNLTSPPDHGGVVPQ